jgi:ferric-dicitrate binding protein FerR (iron transport regulator)
MCYMTPRVPDEFDDEQLARYLSGECSPPESAAILAWLDADDDRRRRIEVLRQGWSSAEGIQPRGDVDAGWTAISAKMSDDGNVADRRAAPPALRLQPVARKRAVATQIAGRAAAIVVAVGLGAFAARELGWRKPAEAPSSAAAPEMRVVATKSGERANVYLSDGTQVTLGVGSTLRFPVAFTSSRDVELDGEAYFEVAHDTMRVFAVHMRHGTARDLGTKFGVRAYRDIAAATITVTEGAVMLTPAVSANAATVTADSLVVNAKDIGRVSVDGHLSVRRNVRTDGQLAWMSGRLVFDQMPVGEAVAQINRWYGVDVKVGDASLARFTLTASLTNEPFDRAIKIVAAALDARVERRGSKVLLYPARDRS